MVRNSEQSWTRLSSIAIYGLWLSVFSYKTKSIVDGTGNQNRKKNSISIRLNLITPFILQEIEQALGVFKQKDMKKFA